MPSQTTYQTPQPGSAPLSRTAGDDPASAIRFALDTCSLGVILIAASARGVCAIMLGDDPDTLVGDLHARFADARPVVDDAEFEHLFLQVISLVESPGSNMALPIDPQGSAFQKRVWEALRQIPAGITLSYAELADRIGAPGSARAVAGACAANPLAVAIPCHRVVRSDGSLSGYRWGIERKRALLHREAVIL